ncbi:MAG TPA: Xaa-Pro peptidase family protein [Puia sp.]|nr:Xaa-Pro peptidase family protein [Puia sp.]
MDRYRKEITDRLLRRHQLSALVFWRPDELVMMLGYMPLWGLSVLLYTADGEPVLFVPELEPDDCLPQHIEIRRFPWGVHNGEDPWPCLYKLMADVLRLKDLTRLPCSYIPSIGGSAPCRMSGEQPPLPADLVQQFASLAGGFRDITSDLLRLYEYKSPTDVAGLHLAHEVAGIAIREFYAEVVKGHSEARLAGLIELAVQETIDRDGIGFAKAWPMVQSGLNTADAGRFNRSTGKVIRSEGFVLLEMGVCVNGYWADITRTALPCEPSPEQQSLYDTVSRAQTAAIHLIRPGMAMRQVDAAARNIIRDAGFGDKFNHALGHHVGFRYHDPGEVLSPYSEGVFREGMVVTVEPGVYIDRMGGLRIEDNILVTGEGNQVLSNFPRTLNGK